MTRFFLRSYISAPRPSTVYGTESIEMIYRGPGFFAVVHICSSPSYSVQNREYWKDLIEDQVFLRSYDTAPRPPPSPPLQSKGLSLFPSLPVCRQLSLLMREGGGGSEKPNQTAARKAWPSIYYSILSGLEDRWRKTFEISEQSSVVAKW